MKPSSIHSLGFRIVAPLLAALLCGLVLAGCIIIPVDYHAVGSRHNVTQESTNALRLSVTTPEDLLLTMGEPDFVSEDGGRFGYLWTKVKAIWGSYGGAGGAFIRSYLMEASFDRSNRLAGVRLLKQWGETVPSAPDAAVSR